MFATTTDGSFSRSFGPLDLLFEMKMDIDTNGSREKSQKTNRKAMYFWQTT